MPSEGFPSYAVATAVDSSSENDDVPTAAVVHPSEALLAQRYEDEAEDAPDAAEAGEGHGEGQGHGHEGAQPSQSLQPQQAMHAHYRHRLDRCPPDMSHEELDLILDRLVSLAQKLDARFRIGPVAFGADTIIGVLPGGDLITTALASYVAWSASRLGLPRGLQNTLWYRVAVDFALGLVPLVGDIADTFYKANIRNVDDILRYFGRTTYSEMVKRRRKEEKQARKDAKKRRRQLARQQQQQTAREREGRRFVDDQAPVATTAAVASTTAVNTHAASGAAGSGSSLGSQPAVTGATSAASAGPFAERTGLAGSLLRYITPRRI
jgi:hypothetical protein